MGPAERPLDLTRLLATLHRHGVDYVVIGGVAVQVHGHRRTTMDLDLMPEPSLENLERLAAALEELEAQPRDMAQGETQASVADPERLATAAVLPPLSTRHGALHILNEPKGARPFDQLRGAALMVEVEGIEVPIVALDDLLRMKRASGRRADLEDIAALTVEESRGGD